MLFLPPISLVEALSLCDAFIASESFQEAEELLQALIAGGQDSHLLRVRFAEVSFRRGDLAGGHAQIAQARELAPGNLVADFLIGHLYTTLGMNERAVGMFQGIVGAFPRFSGAYTEFARAVMPGPGYHAVLQKLHQYCRPRTYLEIGVCYGNSLRFAGTAHNIVGVDPNLKSLKYPLDVRCKMFEMGSDDFFARDLLPKAMPDPVDMTFIDGMHLSEYALRDFINVEKHSHKESIVILHDCLPVDAQSSARDETTGWWVGDVWKVMVILKKYRPDLDLFTIRTQPSGLGVIRNLDPSSHVLSDLYPQIEAELLAMDYDEELKDKDRALSVVDSDLATYRARLPVFQTVLNPT